jgi:DNA-binding NtrC family response regulator
MPETVLSQGAAHRIAVITADERLEPAVQQFLASTFHTTILNSPDELVGLQNDAPLKAVIVDLDDVDDSGEQRLELISALHKADPGMVLIGLARSRSRTLRNKARKAGIDEWFVAPVDFQEVQTALAQALEERQLEAEALQSREEALRRNSFCDLIGASEPMRLVYEAISRVAHGNATVMIRGESGTGKELVAKAVVTSSPRRDKPWVSVNCAALPESLIESELFGHEKGSFTGAHESRPGQIELAHGGTLFLDEIGTLGLALQSKLLRVLEQHMVHRIGAKVPKKIDFRLITATNANLEAAVEAGRFREDLYYRIHVVPIFLPPLREREGDVALLADHFLRFYCRANAFPFKRLEPDVLEILEDYLWPGNVRELENVMQRLVLMVPGEVITAKHLPHQILYASTAKQESLLIPEAGISFDEEIAKIEVAYLEAALRRTFGRKAEAARLLRIDPQKMKYLCRKYNLKSGQSV